jgi:isopenicillin-N epimerase
MTGLPDASSWTLDRNVAYLNHGGFGAAPASVLAAQQGWRDALERNPTGFLVRQLPDLLTGVRAKLAAFLGADPAGLVFTDNATAGMQTIIAQLKLGPGDEVVTTDHAYVPVLTQLRKVAEATGAKVKVAHVPVPAASRSAVADAIMSEVSGLTKFVVVDHVASCSGMVFPVDLIVAQCRPRGIGVVIDGAHAPGLVPVDLDGLGADFWVGNLHKWLCAPKVTAVLHAAAQWRDGLRPLVASHRFDDGYQAAFDWTGTHDPSPLLAATAALEFFEQAGWPAVWEHNNDLAERGAGLVARQIGTAVAGNAGDGLTAAMRLIQLPEPLGEFDAREIERRLEDEYKVVVPITYHGGWQWLRVSAQLYNTISDYERLAAALIKLGIAVAARLFPADAT